MARIWTSLQLKLWWWQIIIGLLELLLTNKKKLRLITLTLAIVRLMDTGMALRSPLCMMIGFRL